MMVELQLPSRVEPQLPRELNFSGPVRLNSSVSRTRNEFGKKFNRVEFQLPRKLNLSPHILHPRVFMSPKIVFGPGAPTPARIGNWTGFGLIGRKNTRSGARPCIFLAFKPTNGPPCIFSAFKPNNGQMLDFEVIRFLKLWHVRFCCVESMRSEEKMWIDSSL